MSYNHHSRHIDSILFYILSFIVKMNMFEEIWNQLEQEAVTACRNTYFQQVKYAMNEGMLLEGAIQKIVKNLWGVKNKNCTKWNKMVFSSIWTDLKHAIDGLNTLQAGFPLTAKDCSYKFSWIWTQTEVISVRILRMRIISAVINF